MHRFSSCVLVSVLALGCAGAANSASVPLTYNAITDINSRPKPPLPNIGGAGTIFTDPTFGTRILRVTDAHSAPEFPGTSVYGPAGGFINNWNADSTMFWVETQSGEAIPYKFDASTLKASRMGDLNNGYGGLVILQMKPGTFSYQKPNILYGHRDRQILQYDFNTNTFTTLFDANTAVPGATGWSYAVSVSNDDTRFCLAFGGIQDTYPYIVVWNRATGAYTVLNTRDSTVDGRPTAIPLGFGIHSAYMDRSGRYVVIGKGEGKVQGTSDWVIWDSATGNVQELQPDWSGHEVSGFGDHINWSGFYGGSPEFYDGTQFAYRRFDNLSQERYLIDWTMLPTPHLAIEDGHLSWNNAQPDKLVPVFASVIRNTNDASQPWRAWEDEIIGIRTDGVQSTVWRFAHHRSLWDGNNFWDTPRGNISQNGRYYLFTSNWERTLGTDPQTGSARQDVFIVELPVGDSTTATSTTSTATPPPATSSDSTAITSGSTGTTGTTATTGAVTPIRINAGGGSYTDSSGRLWQADTNFSGGRTYQADDAVSNTNNPNLYKTERYGPMTYSFAVPNGPHQVNLKFAEIYFSSPGMRVFNVVINGQTVLSNFDIVRQAGGRDVAMEASFAVPVTNGQITITFVPVIENPKISGIEIF